MGTKTKTEAEAAIGGRQSGVNRKSGRPQRSTAAKDTVVAASSPKSSKGARRSSRSSRINSGALVCRYCGSDDLAPSFKKRRDARCRACFKKRYGTKAKGQKSKRPGKAKASK
jgi:hypothetical protein